MDCSTFKSNIFALREGELPAGMQHALKDHQASCRACSRLMDEFDGLDMIIAAEKAAEPAPFAATRILQHIENDLEKSLHAISPAWMRLLQPAAIVVALLFGILVGSYNARKGTPREYQALKSSENVDFLRSNLFISEFADEDKTFFLNK